jgi:hypothetical protein
MTFELHSQLSLKQYGFDKYTNPRHLDLVVSQVHCIWTSQLANFKITRVRQTCQTQSKV